ncbi:MAG: M20/M25/M40 family metallo-hydrolase [Pseudomonadota bacterium]
MSRRALLSALALSTCAASEATDLDGPPHPAAVTPRPYTEIITPEALGTTVGWLASPALRGRLPGTDGYDRAARWAAARFGALGLRPVDPAGDFLQRFPLELNEISRCHLEIPGWDGPPLVQGVDYACRGFTGSGRFAAPVAFVGYGLSLPEQGWDEHAGLDLSGRALLCFKQPPTWKLDDVGWGEAAMPRPRAAWAQAHGARAVLTVSRPDNAWSPQPIGSVMHGPGEQQPDLPQLEVSPALATFLTRETGLDLPALQAAIDTPRAPASRLLAATVSVDVRAYYEPEAPAANVVALLPGADPVLREEIVIVGAHLDHVGAQGEVVYPGANDNASGSAVVLALAEAFAASPEPPARSVLFILFAAEESGLLGSAWFVAHPLVDLEQVVAVLNLDCVGHGPGQLELGGGGASPDLWALARGLDDDAMTVEETWPGGGADLQAFFDAGLPTLYFVTEGSYTHLHKPSDTLETLDLELLARVGRLCFRTLAAVARGEYRREPHAEE